MDLKELCMRINSMVNSNSEKILSSELLQLSKDCSKAQTTLIPFWLSICCVVILIALSGIFSGLTLGLLSLNINELQILVNASSVNKYKKFAKRILFVRKHGNWLLCTLLLGNVAVNAAMTVLLDELFLSNPLYSFVVSATLITFFGEILPQAICSRKALLIGYYTVPMVVCIMALLCPIAWPLGKFFDIVLGEEIGHLYNNAELKELIQVHVRQKNAELKEDQGRIIHGALDYSKLSVSDVMTPWKNVFALPDSTLLTFQVLVEIFKMGLSRIPVVNKDQNIVGILFVKDLILVDPEDAIPVSSILKLYQRKIVFVEKKSSLDKVLINFSSGHGHLAIVFEEIDIKAINNYEKKETSFVSYLKKSKSKAISEKVVLSKVKSLSKTDLKDDIINKKEKNPIGIITLEDIVEKILNVDIVDETDVFVNSKKKDLVKRKQFDLSRLEIFNDQKLYERPLVNQKEGNKLFLRLVEIFNSLETENKIGTHFLKILFRLSYIEQKDISEKGLKIYNYGEETKFCIVLLKGELNLIDKYGNDKTLKPFEAIYPEILKLELLDSKEPFKSEYDVIALSSIRILKINRYDLRKVINLENREKFVFNNL